MRDVIFEEKFLEFAKENGLIEETEKFMVRELTINCSIDNFPLVKVEYYVVDDEPINWRKEIEGE